MAALIVGGDHVAVYTKLKFRHSPSLADAGGTRAARKIFKKMQEPLDMT